MTEAAAASAAPQPATTTNPDPGQISFNLPRVTIKYCTQCRWMLRAAYFAQELLSTFSTTIGEIALIPATGGIFTVSIVLSHADPDPNAPNKIMQETVLWDRKREGGFPETKQLKALVRNVIDPSRDLGHVDRALLVKKEKEQQEQGQGQQGQQGQESAGKKEEEEKCDDCK